MQSKTFDEIQQDMRNYIIAHQDKLTDFNDGSVLESQIEATARELAILYVRCRVGFSSFLRALPYSIFNFNMKEGLKASVKTKFSRSKIFSNDTPIPIGTIVAAGDLKFITTEVGSIASGAMASNEISAVAENVGEKYNVGASMIKTLISTMPADVVSVDNPGAATGGIDSEDWGSYIDRFGRYILGLSRTNGYGFQSGLTADHLVRSLEIEEHFPPVDNLWNITVYLEDGSGGMAPDAITEVKKRIDGNRMSGDGGYRAPGINVRYLTPTNRPINLAITVTTERDVANEIDESVVMLEVAEAVKKFINGLLIGQSVLISDVIIMLKRIVYLDDVQIPNQDNIKIEKNQIARFGECIVTVVIPNE